MNALSKHEWFGFVEKEVREFSNQYNVLYNISEKKLWASFEIGCFHALLNFYKKNAKIVEPRNLIKGYFKYLTTPSGRPENFSYIYIKLKSGIECEIRQQVRVSSHIHEDICFTPDIIVIKSNDGDSVEIKKSLDYANGKRGFCFVKSENVFAAHECKSLVPFPELMVSFVGTLIVAHRWLKGERDRSLLRDDGDHLAPTLFVGGAASGLHKKLIAALQETMPMNVVDGLHLGKWDLHGKSRKINRFSMI